MRGFSVRKGLGGRIRTSKHVRVSGWRVDPRLGRRGMAHEGITVPTQGHERVDPWLDSL